jgi:hypothetical protein
MVLPEKTTDSRTLWTSAVSIVMQFGVMLQHLWAHAALPMSGALVVVKHTVHDDVLDWAPVADACVLAPFFFGLLCMQALDRRQRSESADPSFGSPIYHLCL